MYGTEKKTTAKPLIEFVPQTVTYKNKQINKKQRTVAFSRVFVSQETCSFLRRISFTVTRDAPNCRKAIPVLLNPGFATRC